MRSTAIPILPVGDLDRTLRFFGALGFSIDFEQGEPEPYAIVALDEVELHFYVPADPSGVTSGRAYLRVASADALHRTWDGYGLAAEGAPRLGPIDDRPSGMREFELVDPDGHRFQIGHPIDLEPASD